MHNPTLLILGLMTLSIESVQFSPKYTEQLRSWGSPLQHHKPATPARPLSKMAFLQGIPPDPSHVDVGLRIEMANLNPTGLITATNDTGTVITNNYSDVYSPSIAVVVQAHVDTNGVPETVTYTGTNFAVSGIAINAPVIVTDWTAGTLAVTNVVPDTNSTPYVVGSFASMVSVLSWDTQIGQSYQLECSSDVIGWHNVNQLVFAGTGTRIQTMDDGMQPKRFYRVRVWTP